MRNPDYSSVDSKTGSVNYNGPSEIMPGDHNHMPSRSDAYMPGDERGHVQASSLGGTNGKSNIVPQNADVNHGGYYSLEQGERAAVNNGASIQTDKTAYASNQPGARPDAFMVTDTVTYADGHTETVHHSFANEAYGDQEARNNQSAALPETFEAPNPGDSLRDSMSTHEYSELMEETDASLPNISDDYAESDFSGNPSVEAWDSDLTVGTDDSTEAGSEIAADSGSIDAGANAGDGGGADAGDGGGAAADSD